MPNSDYQIVVDALKGMIHASKAILPPKVLDNANKALAIMEDFKQKYNECPEFVEQAIIIDNFMNGDKNE